jgi:hypothetical protein
MICFSHKYCAGDQVGVDKMEGNVAGIGQKGNVQWALDLRTQFVPEGWS